MAAGAAAASVLTELIVMGVQFYLVRCALPLRDILLGFRTHLFASLIMFGLVTFAAGSLSPSLVHTSLLVLLGSASYFLLLLLFKDDMTHLVIQNSPICSPTKIITKELPNGSPEISVTQLFSFG